MDCIKCENKVEHIQTLKVDDIPYKEVLHCKSCGAVAIMEVFNTNIVNWSFVDGGCDE